MRHLTIRRVGIVLGALVLALVLFIFVIPIQTYNGYDDASPCQLINYPRPRLTQTDFHILRGQLEAYQQAKEEVGDYWYQTCDDSLSIRLHL